MAYKQNPGRGNQSKTGHGVPAPFKQTMGAVGAGAGTPTGKYITKKVNQAGSAISSAHKAGKKAFIEGTSADSFATGSGAMRSYKRDGLDYVTGFASDLLSGNNTKTNEKKKPVAKQMKKSPVKQMETIKKVYSKGKELVSKAGSAISSAHKAGKKAFIEGTSADSFATGSGAMRSYKRDGLDYVTGFVSDLASDKNTKTNEKKKSPAKMKKC